MESRAISISRRAVKIDVADAPVAAAVIVGAAAVLRVFPPGPGGIYPPCPFHWLTGLLCPGCGSLRSLRALTDGDLLAAWTMNPLFLLFVGGLAGALVVRGLQFDLKVPAAVYRAVPLVVLGYWVLRNF